MTRSKPIVTCTPVLQRSQVALRCIVALAALAAVPTARADAPTPTTAPTQPVSPDMLEKTGPSGQAADTATPTRCQDRRDVKWIRRCLPERNTWELGVFAGVHFPANGSHELFDAYKQREARWMGQEFWRPYRTAAPAIGLRAAYFPLRFLGGEVEGSVMPTRVIEDGAPGARANLFSLRAHLVGQVPLWRVTPFVVWGTGGIGTTGALGNDFDPMTHFGAGVKLFLTQRTLLRLDVRDNVAAKKEVDAGATHYPEVLLGFSTVLGRKPPKRVPATDSDGDGFLDRSDACPYEPGRAPDGCPERDRDADGFMDSQDACPDVPGIAPDGCPEQDRDADGFLDSVDRCPDVPGIAPDGCPIPDTDGDGYLDNADGCVDRPESWNGYLDADGCPDEVPRTIPRGVIRGIYFDLDRDTIKPRSRPVLDRAVAIFTEFPDVRVAISGHTDSTGAARYACRQGRGTHRCLGRGAELMRRRRYVLRVDVARFFASVDHTILRAQLDRVTPPELRWLRDRFLDAPLPAGAVEPVAFHFPGDELFTPLTRPHGLPIGSLTSQIWANLALSPLDHLLGSYLGLGEFVRYCDDILVFADDPGRLRAALEQLHARATALRLRLHPQKTRLHRTSDPVSFVGFVLRRRGDAVSIRLRGDNVRRMRQRVAALQVEFAAGGLAAGEVTARLRAWLAHAAHGHTRALVEREHERWVFRRRGDGDDEGGGAA